MTNLTLRYSLTVIILILLQVFILNHIHLLGMGTPFLYIYAIISLPSSYNKITQLLVAFFIGMIIDLFSYSPGMHASACLCIGLINPYLFKTFSPQNDFEIAQPSIHSFGFRPFFYYILISTLIHHIVLIFLEISSFHFPEQTFTRIGLCTVLTVIFILVTDLINHSRT